MMDRTIETYKIPPKDRRGVFNEIQVPLHDSVDRRSPPPGWNPDGTRSDKKAPERAYDPEIPRWN